MGKLESSKLQLYKNINWSLSFNKNRIVNWIQRENWIFLFFAKKEIQEDCHFSWNTLKRLNKKLIHKINWKAVSKIPWISKFKQRNIRNLTWVYDIKYNFLRHFLTINHNYYNKNFNKNILKGQIWEELLLSDRYRLSRISNRFYSLHRTHKCRSYLNNAPLKCEK